ncbi:MAG: hypothetical protein ACFFBD_06030 [Candidatus Hodarchaeota archaeon]
MVDEQDTKGDPRMKKAYEASSRLLRERLAKERPEDLKLLDDIEEADIIVVEGQYDHAQVNFKLAGIPHKVISPPTVDSLEITSDQLLFINCPGSGIGDKGIKVIQHFVGGGGMLVTTDWALLHVLEKAFPGVVKYNQQPTRDDVVRVEILDGGEDSFIHNVIDKTDDPQWWLEGSSYPIQILDQEKVKVLVTSKEMEEKYGEAPILISFKVGEGEVIHMTSHFYLQRTETRTKRHAKSGESYAMEKGFTQEQAKAMNNLQDLSVAEVESAYTSQAFMADMVMKQKKRVQKRKEEKE